LEHGQSEVSILPITQATTATFADLYFRPTFLFFVQAGSKRVLSPPQDELIGEEGDLLIFPAGSMVTMENRPVMDRDYRAVGVSFSDDLIDTVFADQRPSASAGGIQIVRARPSRPVQIVPMIQDTVENRSLPEPIRRHRLLEPLVWLRHHGYQLGSQAEESPPNKVRGLIETDFTRSWRASDVADHLAMSEATSRRRLSTAGQGFAKIWSSPGLVDTFS